MGKINSRHKGASFEREVAIHLNVFFESIGVPLKVKRNLEQYQEKDLGDLNVPNHTIECKRYANGNWYKEEWWQQVVNSCGSTIPVLIWKYNRQPIRVCLPMHVLTKGKKDLTKTVVTTFEDWLDILAKNL